MFSSLGNGIEKRIRGVKLNTATYDVHGLVTRVYADDHMLALSIQDFLRSFRGQPEAEAGFLTTAEGTNGLKAKLDSNSDNVILGEGDDAATAPILVDVLTGQTTLIPGTSYRTTGVAAADTTVGPAMQTKVANHRAAGISTDIITYCLTGHSQSRVTMAYGAMSGAGYFGSPAPKVTGLKWGRQGWNFGITTAPVYTGTGAISATPVGAGTFTTPASSAVDCTGLTGGDLVRCAAQGALAPTGAGGTPVLGATVRTVDLRQTVDVYVGTGSTVQDSLDTLFTTAGLAKLDSTKTLWFYNRTAHTSLMAAEGANMLGFTAQGIRYGLAGWNASYGEQQLAPGNSYAYLTVAAGAGVDTTAPTVSSMSAGSITTSSALINRVAGEPATMKVEYGTVPGVYSAIPVNNTVLNANKTVPLSGLNGGTTYYYRVTSYDGQANGTVSAEGSFTTVAACTPGRPSLSLSAPAPFWVSYADYTARLLSINWTISNTGTNGATNVAITGSTNTNGVSISTALPASVGSIGAASSAVVTLKYNVPLTTGSWRTSTTASAGDDCGGTGYTYPY